ncbi:MMPL family transporter [Smaragdicoccus niigatensis]|uniref:MMPL family transporter n=1 Tax=Smaragdicoccus niigatensis TaxID=359359 RepID=UPI00138ABBF8|nr:MMPL family transporter [Smaragdicoccus niigatensis]
MTDVAAEAPHDSGPVRDRKSWAPVAVLLLALAVMAGALFYGLGSQGSMAPTVLTVDGSDSARADEILTSDFTVGRPQLLFKVDTPKGVDDPTMEQQGLALTARIAAAPGVTEAGSYWSEEKLPLMRGSDKDFALILISLKGSRAEQRDTAVRLMDEFTGKQGDLTLEPTGEVPTQIAIEKQSRHDLWRAVLLPAPIVVLLLVAFFGPVTALITLGIGAFGVSVGIGLLRVVDQFTPMSVFAINIVTALGLGLAANFTLYVISRQRRVGNAASALRVVSFSVATIAVGSCALFVFPLGQLRSFAFAGIVGAIGAGVGALVVLPAVLTLLGGRINRFNTGLLTRGIGARWDGLGRAIVRWPTLPALIATGVAIVIASPAAHGIHFAESNEKVLPTENSVRATTDAINAGMGGPKGSVMVVLPGVDASARTTEVSNYATELSKVDGVVRVDAATGSYAMGMLVKAPFEQSKRLASPEGSVLSVGMKYPGDDSRAIELVRYLRGMPAPSEPLVTGGAASILDAKNALVKWLPVAGGLLAAFVVLVMLWFSRSVVTGLLAVVSCGLTLTAMVGAVVYLFPTGIDVDMTMLMLVVAFFFAIDRHIFLIGAIGEQREEGNSSATIVAKGVGVSAPIIVGTTIIVAVVLAAFATSGLAPMRMLGIGLGVGVILDAVLMRLLLVPAVMTLAGPVVWKLPEPAEKLADAGRHHRGNR